MTDDLVSRRAVLDAMRKNHRSGGRDIDGDYIEGDYIELLYDDIISLPPVTPQSKQEPILDKIRAEILEEKDSAYADFEQYKVDYLSVDAEYAEDELPLDDFRYGMERAIEIIDKYKTERET